LEGCNAGTIPDKVQFAFVTHSLGSRMLYDVLAPRQEDGTVSPAAPGTARAALQQKTDVVYMAANQLPLLALGQLQVGPIPRPAPAPPGAPAAPGAAPAAARQLRLAGLPAGGPAARRGRLRLVGQPAAGRPAGPA
jgi:hypothetical protein